MVEEEVAEGFNKDGFALRLQLDRRVKERLTGRERGQGSTSGWKIRSSVLCHVRVETSRSETHSHLQKTS